MSTVNLWLPAALFALLAFGAMGAVAFPLLRRPAESAVRAEYDVRVYRDQLAEVDRDVERGLTTPEQAEAARLEIQRRLLAADAEAQAVSKAQAPAPGRRFRVILAVLLGLMVPVGAVVVYGMVGTPGYADRPIAAREAERLGMSDAQLAAARAEEAKRQAALTANPKDQAAWMALAEVRQGLQRPREALEAWDKALALGPVDADAWSLIGEANVLANNGTVVEAAQTAFRNALLQNRGEPRARWYLGLAESQQNRPIEAIAIWRDLSRDSAPDAPWSPMLRARIAQVAQQAGVMPNGIAPRHPLDAPGSASDSSAPAAAANDDAMIAGMVQRLKDRLAGQPDDFDGWMRLGRSLMVLGDADGGAEAYGKAVALKPADRDARFAYATALATVAGKAGQAPGEAFFAVVDGMVKEQPDGPDSLYLGGLAAKLKGDIAAARTQWEKLRESLPEGSTARQAVEEQINQL